MESFELNAARACSKHGGHYQVEKKNGKQNGKDDNGGLGSVGVLHNTGVIYYNSIPRLYEL